MAKQWPGLFDVTSPPGGLPLFAYTCLCSCLAAGDSAQASGGNYVASCCGPLICPWFGLCTRCADRKRMATKHAVAVEGPLMLTLLLCFCGPCTLEQELKLEAENQGVVSVFNAVALVAPVQGSMGDAPASLVASIKDSVNGLIN